MPRLDREADAAGPVVTGFAAGGFRIGEAVHRALLLTPEWAREWSAPALEETALAALIELAPPPEFILIGTGATLVRPPAATVAALEARGIGIEPMDSRAAARAWGMLRSEGRWIAAALMPLD